MMAARLAGVVTRGVVTRINDKLKAQSLQIELRFGEVADNVEHFQPFGLSFHPSKASEVIVFAVGGSQDNLVALAAMDRDVRPADISEGEGGLYTPSGWKLFCADDDTVSAGSKVGEDWASRSDRTDAEIKTIRDAIMNAIADPPMKGSSGLLMSLQTALSESPQQPTKSDKLRTD